LKQNKATLHYSRHNPKHLRPADLNRSGAELGTKVGKTNPPSITVMETQQGNLRTNANAVSQRPTCTAGYGAKQPLPVLKTKGLEHL